MKAFLVLTTVVLALALGVVATHRMTPTLAPYLVIGFGATVWVMSHALERMAGGDLWDFSAPYPYRWMREEHAHDLPPRPLDKKEHAATDQGSSQSRIRDVDTTLADVERETA
jgi:hypothetical protein